MITDTRLQWLSSPDYIRSEPGQVAADLLASRKRVIELESALSEALEYIGLDSEYPQDMMERWFAALAGKAPAPHFTSDRGTERG
jgi:hypothetical protein